MASLPNALALPHVAGFYNSHLSKETLSLTHSEEVLTKAQ